MSDYSDHIEGWNALGDTNYQSLSLDFVERIGSFDDCRGCESSWHINHRGVSISFANRLVHSVKDGNLSVSQIDGLTSLSRSYSTDYIGAVFDHHLPMESALRASDPLNQ